MNLELHVKHISPRVRKIAITALLVNVTGAVFFITLGMLNKPQQTVKGVNVAKANISSLSPEASKDLITENLNSFQKTTLVISTQDGIEILTTPQELGVVFNTEKILEHAYSYGKTENFIQKAINQSRALIFGFNIPLYADINNPQFLSFVKTALKDVHRPAQNANFKYDQEAKEFKFVSAKKGKIINLIKLENEVVKRAERLSVKPIEVKQQEDIPLVEKEGADAAKKNAEKIITGIPYTIKARDNEWDIEKDEIISWIRFYPELNSTDSKYYLKTKLSEPEINNYLNNFAPGLAIKPINAAFALENGKVTVFSLPKNGQELNADESIKAIKNALENQNSDIKLVFNDIEPAITKNTISDLGINSLVGKGETDFAGSPTNRKHNIKVGADKYQGLLINPGETFSFVKNLGAVTAAEGYLPELVIKQNRTIPEYGGGLCQVSTTLFRSALNAGLEIVERRNHAYPVRYYGTPGFDATIYPPSPDLKFKNNTPGHLLIQYKINGTKLAFELYGQDDGRKVELNGPHTYDVKSSGAMKAWLGQTVYNKDGNKILEKTFYSNYKSPKLYPIIRNPLE